MTRCTSDTFSQPHREYGKLCWHAAVQHGIGDFGDMESESPTARRGEALECQGRWDSPVGFLVLALTTLLSRDSSHR